MSQISLFKIGIRPLEITTHL